MATVNRGERKIGDIQTEMCGKGVKAFIDDSGEKEYGSATGRYFVYAGVLVDSANEMVLIAERRPEVPNIRDSRR